MNEPVLSQMYVYPVKSCGGVAVESSRVEERGLEHDRRWMLVDETGTFMSQREYPRMCLVRIEIGRDHLAINAPEMPTLFVPFSDGGRGRLRARVWDDVVEVAPVGAEADRWFGEFLRVSCRMVYLPDESVRPVDPDYSRPGDHTGFADGFPFLLLSEASLEDLNGRLRARSLPMNRFRPSLVVGNCEPFAEDGWRAFRIGTLTFHAVKPCARCAITTTDQRTAEVGKEPLRTLAAFRKSGSKVLFGQNLVHDAVGSLSVGDAVKVTDWR